LIIRNLQTFSTKAGAVTKSTLKIFRNAKLVFWDFDGVIKETAGIKGDVFAGLFKEYGEPLAARIKKHHRNNGGISRFEKIPLYLNWAGLPVSRKKAESFFRRFSQNVFHKVLQAPWVGGAERMLRENPFRQEFVLITATPQREIQKILRILKLQGCFTKVIGAPTPKTKAVGGVIREGKIDSRKCLLIGDSNSDREAAQKNNVPFFFRKSDRIKKLPTTRNTITDFNFCLKKDPPTTKKAIRLNPFLCN